MWDRGNLSQTQCSRITDNLGRIYELRFWTANSAAEFNTNVSRHILDGIIALGDDHRCDADWCDSMGSHARTKLRTAVLKEEINSIHLANTIFWCVQTPGHDAGVEYYRRQDRLEEIRNELCRLTGATNSVERGRYPPRCNCQL